jgi:hypothetical protein
LGLCFLDKEQSVEARQSFEKALKVDGISKEKIMEIELALKDMEQKSEEECGEFTKMNRGERQKTKGSSRPQDKKMKFRFLKETNGIY